MWSCLLPKIWEFNLSAMICIKVKVILYLYQCNVPRNSTVKKYFQLDITNQSNFVIACYRINISYNFVNNCDDMIVIDILSENTPNTICKYTYSRTQNFTTSHKNASWWTNSHQTMTVLFIFYKNTIYLLRPIVHMPQGCETPRLHISISCATFL